MKKFLIAGNWKMHCSPDEAKQLIQGIKSQADIPDEVDVLVCPPSISLTAAVQASQKSKIKVGAQNVHFEDNGAYTGEISTQMLTEAGCSYVIVGHSERREYFGETDAIVNAKTKKALAAGLKPIICIGESLDQRKKNVHQKMVQKQIHAALNEVNKTALKNIVLAYEPLWAIGTGQTATPEQAQEMHAMIHEELKLLYDSEASEMVLVLYGGSMKPHNAESILKQRDVNGGLIGGASLKADSFSEIIKVAGQLSR